jgi:hypothetical protein
MSKKQSKRARFAHWSKVNRTVNRIKRKNKGRPGFVGAVLSMMYSLPDGSPVTLGPGALFFK